MPSRPITKILSDSILSTGLCRSGCWSVFTTLLSVVALLLMPGSSQVAHAQVDGPDCDAPFGIVETLPDGGRWEFCWGYRLSEGINLYNIYFKPKDGLRTKVMADAWISQIHVRYDNDEHSFLDVTQYGLGGENLNNLSSADCPDGELINPSSVNSDWDNKNMICKAVRQREYAFTGLGSRQPGWYLDVFNVATVGQYNYMPTWRFYGDGTIELLMGASGKLQEAQQQSTRTAACEDGDPNTVCRRPLGLAPHSWPLDDIDYFGISHTHNYFWRLDFDVGDGLENDIVEEIEYVASADGRKRRKIVTQLNREAGRSINPKRMRSWRIRDGVIKNADGNNIAWHIEPTLNGHNYTGATLEPWNKHDIYVTKYVECEKFVADNQVPVLDDNGNPTGICPAEVVYPLSGSDVPQNLRTGFVNNESIVNQDIVVYAKLSFHHVPRNEDEPHMHTHWNSLKIVPRSLTVSNSLANGPLVNLRVGTRDAKAYGHMFGNTTYYSRLVTRFIDEGRDLQLEVRGYDADTANEISVHINGRKIGTLAKTLNNKEGQSLSRFSLPRGLQNNPSGSGDANIITFTQRNSLQGTRWGVTDIRIMPD